MVIDAHQHFWAYSAEYAWIGAEMATLRRNYMPEDLAPFMKACGVSATVAVQARQTVGETEWLLSLADRCPWIVGVVGWVDLCSPRVGDDLDRLVSHRRFVGVRHPLESEPDERYMLRPAFCRGLAALGRCNLAYDIVTRPRHLRIGCELVSHYSGQRFASIISASRPSPQASSSPGSAICSGWRAFRRSGASCQGW